MSTRNIITPRGVHVSNPVVEDYYSEPWKEDNEQRGSAAGATPCDDCPFMDACAKGGDSCLTFYLYANSREPWQLKRRRQGSEFANWEDYLADRRPSKMWADRLDADYHDSEWFKAAA